MHLRWEKPVNALIAMAGFLFLGIFMFCLLDFDSRNYFLPENLHHTRSAAGARNRAAELYCVASRSTAALRGGCCPAAAPRYRSQPPRRSSSRCYDWRQMTDQQILTVALASVPTMLAVLMGILINSSRLNDVNTRIGELRSHIDIRFEEIKDMWRSELHRVEGVLDARLKHQEER